MLSWLLRLQCRTWRPRIEGREHLIRLYAAHKPFLLCFWHGKYVPIFPLLEGYDACVVSSRSERGSVIGEICKNFGYRNTRIPDKPSRDSLRLMGAAIIKARAGGIAVDGPLGPRGRVKSGVIRMASELGFPLLPVSVSSHRKIVLNKRWDRLEIPLPFTKVCLVIGEPTEIPPALRRFVPGRLKAGPTILPKPLADWNERPRRW